MKSGAFADIHNPDKPSFREYAVYFHDELEMKNRFGGQIIDPHTGQPMGVTAISYRSEPMVNRAHFLPDKDRGFKYCNPCDERDSGGVVDIIKPDHTLVDGEDVSMSSWTYGDPATFIPRAYVGDPSRFRLIHGGVKETHVFHLHTHQWKLEPDDPDSTIIDSISIAPQETYDIDILHGAGSLAGSIGDHIWHCHLYPHFHEGMWSLWRVFDRLETGKDTVVENGEIIPPLYPNGTYVKALNPLPDRKKPPKKSLRHPGFYNFINGEFRERPKQPPLGILNQIVERYYANEELNACFFHDHLNPNSHQQHGLFGGLIIEPKGLTYHDPQTGKRIKYGTKAVIKTPSGRAFREFGLFVHDFVLLFDRHKKALNPPPFPGSHDDPGVMGINYKCEPLRERLNDKYDDPSDVFNSNIHGDPVTPILETYPGEEIVIRLLDGAQEEQHIFNIHGMKWRKEITDRKSPLVQAQTLGISEAFNIRITDDYKPGDYIYYFGGQDDLWLGLWGIIRVYKNKNNKLIPIDGCKKCSFDKVKSYKDEIKDCMIKSKYCPYKKIREFHIAAIQKDLIYNKYKDHDPYGLLFVPYEIKDDVISGKIEPKPLILRANKSEYIKITLTNCFNEQIPFLKYPGVPVDKKIIPSMRVGISTQFLRFDPVKDSGVNIGYNGEEQTVAPGESKTYLWYADEEYGACLLSSFTDIRNHRYHGLFGAIIIEPEGAKIYSSYDNGYKADYQEQVLVSAGKNEKFREFVLFMQNGIRLVDEKGNLIQTAVEEEETEEPVEHGESKISTENTLKDELAIEPVDFEDRGEKGFNYKSERFFNRLQHNPDISKVFSSKEHEDPSTPVLEAYPGEKVIIRLLMPADKPRNTSFTVHGHEWMARPEDPFTRIISTQGAISVGNVFNIELLNGASMVSGDYLYRSSIIKWDIESGMWGILRIKDDKDCK
ncbi:MAG: hypothetical protein SPD90_08105 [Intestinibacter sp.]|uniref:hypothetical protein n=1 Tax=Intestinibacter sp. TaxID=1965304 RepID=UPI002A81A4F1|nr:hypothetical protein [Intestinibacter sp.]MDY4575007.1 hypothetical protein [Intestinibacter sp.]